MITEKLRLLYQNIIRKLLPYASKRRENYGRSQHITYPRKLSDNDRILITANAETTRIINRNPIIIYQMGKVGSTSLDVSLTRCYQALNIDVPIYKRHILNNFDSLEKGARENRSNPVGTLVEIKHGRMLRERIDRDRSQHWKVISLVREPFGRTIAMFFQMLPEYFPDWEKDCEQGTLSVKDLRSFFQKRMIGFQNSDQWFDSQMKAVFDIDVFASPFPIAKGYHIYNTPRADLLLFRLESLNANAEMAIEEFLGIKGFKLASTNIGDQKHYADLYQLFRNEPFPVDYVKSAYETRFAHHFYTQSEREKFIKQWTHFTSIK
jgi:hypothetical protein